MKATSKEKIERCGRVLGVRIMWMHGCVRENVKYQNIINCKAAWSCCCHFNKRFSNLNALYLLNLIGKSIWILASLTSVPKGKDYSLNYSSNCQISCKHRFCRMHTSEKYFPIQPLWNKFSDYSCGNYKLTYHSLTSTKIKTIKNNAAIWSV